MAAQLSDDIKVRILEAVGAVEAGEVAVDWASFFRMTKSEREERVSRKKASGGRDKKTAEQFLGNLNKCIDANPRTGMGKTGKESMIMYMKRWAEKQ